MKFLLTTLLFAVVFLLSSCDGTKKVQKTESAIISKIDIQAEGYQKLFNGKNLDGWQVITDNKGPDEQLFTVKNEVMHVYPTQEHGSLQSFGAILTEKEYSNYKLSLEYKWGQNKFKPRYDLVRDAGLLFHVYDEAIIWPSSVECQIQEGDSGDMWIIRTQVTSKINQATRAYSPNGELDTRGSRERLFNRVPRSSCWERPGWNTVEIEVKGDDAKFMINGKLVNEAIDMKFWEEESQTWQPLTRGKILLQAEGAELFYRNIYIKEL